MTDDAKDVARQFALYADAITGCAVVQLLGFIYLLTHGDCFTANVMSRPEFPIVGSIIVNVVYLILVLSCHGSENRMLGALSPRDPMFAPLVKSTRGGRCAVIKAAWIATLVILCWVWYCMWRHVFYGECKGTP